jgi:hypothetical protein
MQVEKGIFFPYNEICFSINPSTPPLNVRGGWVGIGMTNCFIPPNL